MRKPGGACGPGPHPQYVGPAVGPRMPHGYRVPNLWSKRSTPVHQRSTRPAPCGVRCAPICGASLGSPCWCTCCGASLLAPSGEERTLDTFAQVERAGRCCRRFDSGTHAWCGHATVMVLVSSASGPRVSGCTFYPRSAVKYFNPISVKPYPAPWVRASCVTVFLVSRCAGSLLVSNTLMTA